MMKKKLRILIVTSFYPPFHVGGACTHAYYLANGLAAQGHKITVLYNKDAYYLKRKGTPRRSDYPNHRNIKLEEITTPLGRMGPLTSYITSAIPFPKEVRGVMEKDYDLIHYHNISLWGPRVLLMGSAPKIYTAHDHWLICPMNGFYRAGDICKRTPGSMACASCLLEHRRPVQLWRFSSILKRGLKEMRLIITPSHYMGGFLKSQGIKNRIDVVPNFVPDALLGKEKRRKDQRKPYLFFAGMLEETKGIKVLLEAWTGIPDRRLLIAGTGSLQGWTERFIKENGMGDRVKLLGFVPGNMMHSYYRFADGFILPSASPENAPLTILEAMSYGTPTIGTAVGGIPEMVKAIDPKLIARRGDVEDLRRVIKGFDPGNYQHSRISDLFKKEYSLQKFLQRYRIIISRYVD